MARSLQRCLYSPITASSPGLGSAESAAEPAAKEKLVHRLVLEATRANGLYRPQPSAEPTLASPKRIGFLIFHLRFGAAQPLFRFLRLATAGPFRLMPSLFVFGLPPSSE